MSRILQTRFSLWAIASILMGLNVVSCATNGTGNKQTVGAVSGAVIGGLIGTQIGSGSGKILATAAGAAVGAFAGSEIGKYLDEQDRQAQAQATAKAIEATPEQNTVTWENPETNVKGEVTAGPVIQETRTVTVREIPKMSLIGANYRAISDSNVRSEPSLDSEVIAILLKDEIFEAVGKVENTNWMLAGRDGHTLGYVSGELVEPVPAAGRGDESVNPVESVSVNPDTATVSVTSHCRNVIRAVTLSDGETHEEEIKYCQQTDGSWIASEQHEVS